MFENYSEFGNKFCSYKKMAHLLFLQRYKKAKKDPSKVEVAEVTWGAEGGLSYAEAKETVGKADKGEERYPLRFCTLLQRS